MDQYSILGPHSNPHKDGTRQSDWPIAESSPDSHPPNADTQATLFKGPEFGHEATFSIAGSENPESELNSILQLTAERAQYITGASASAIALKKGPELVCCAATGTIAPDCGARLEMKSGLIAECIRTAEVLRCDNADLDPRVNIESCRRLGIESVVVMPLYQQNELIGIFELFASHAYAFQERDIQTLKGMAAGVISALNQVGARRNGLESPPQNDVSAGISSSLEENSAIESTSQLLIIDDSRLQGVCKSCGALIDMEAAICPQCDASNPLSALPFEPAITVPAWRQTLPIKRLLLPVLFVALALLVAFAPIPRRKANPPAFSSDQAPGSVPSSSLEPSATPNTVESSNSSSSGNVRVSTGVKQLLTGVGSDFSKLLPTTEKEDLSAPANDPSIKVWVDTRKGYYYCPGDEQYGRTGRGTYMSQREAQTDYYIPALMKPCS